MGRKKEKHLFLWLNEAPLQINLTEFGLVEACEIGTGLYSEPQFSSLLNARSHILKEKTWCSLKT